MFAGAFSVASDINLIQTNSRKKRMVLAHDIRKGVVAGMAGTRGSTNVIENLYLSFKSVSDSISILIISLSLHLISFSVLALLPVSQGEMHSSRFNPSAS